MTDEQRSDFASAMDEDRRIQDLDGWITDSCCRDSSDSDSPLTSVEQQLAYCGAEPEQVHDMVKPVCDSPPAYNLTSRPPGPQDDERQAAAGTRQPFQHATAHAPKKRGHRGAGKSKEK
eukprot:1536807-Rhodomonas_salina.1